MFSAIELIDMDISKMSGMEFSIAIIKLIARLDNTESLREE